MFPRRSKLLHLSLVLSMLAGSGQVGCVKSHSSDYNITPASVWTSGQPAAPGASHATPTLSYVLPATRLPGAPVSAPTPDGPHYQPGTTRGPETYVVQPGDMLSAIAERYSVSLETLAQANGISNPDALEVGQTLTIPAVTPQAPGPAYKLVPDSELVYGPLSGQFDIGAFIQNQAGYLADYTQDIKGETLTGAQIVQLAARNDSVNPRLLLALLEYRSGWVTDPSPDPTLDEETPLGFNDGYHIGLYLQLIWAAEALNSGYYRWRSGAATDWLLADGSVVPIDPTINAGTAGVQNFFARLDGYPAWLQDVSPGGFYDAYYLLFGNPFDLAIEPLIPANLRQPPLLLPFEPGRLWAFTGGPHDSWNPGTPWGALDFAPAETQGCAESDAWVTAAADGLVTRIGEGSVYQDLDGDGNEGSGWVLLYMHIESQDRVQPGTYLKAGEAIGHPSCEGGISNGSHLHFTRKFNGEWIPAYGTVPFNLGGWVADTSGEEGLGTLTRGSQVLASFDGSGPINQIQR